jgi:zinc protease
MLTGVTRLSLSNGLQVLLKEIHTSPLVSHWVWYRAGSRDEHPGITGISHWVEHMQFKGTPRFPGGILDKMISRVGGVWNAFTFLDWTTYFETLPSEHLHLALELEADRMVNSLFDPQEVETERSVILSEREGNENEPLFRLNEQVQSTAFQVHTYHHEIIGERVDLESITRDDLYSYYRASYVPDNAILAIAGDFDSEALAQRVVELYDPVQPGSSPARIRASEPPQQEEKRVVLEGPGETTYIQIAHHAPAASHPDFFPLTVLDSLLTGPSNLNMFSSGISNRTSRLYRSLVETEKAVSVFGGITATIDPFLHGIHAIVHPMSSPDDVLAITEREIESLQETSPPEEELERAVKQARALFAYGSESITNQAFWLGFAEMFSSYDWFLNYLDNLSSVTPQDVQRVAREYLRPQNRVTGVYLPESLASKTDL